MTRRAMLLIPAALVALGTAVVLLIFRDPGPIRIGVLHSLSGTMAISEKPLVDAVTMAVEQINEKGGLLGRRVQTVVVDGRSSPSVFAQEAERLIVREKVVTVFGCWTSASRRTVRPVFEKYNHLLFYPVQYEGLEESPNIIYTGAAANQQIIPAVKWALGNLGSGAFLVGSDYVFPRTANAIIRDYVKKWRGRIVGEEYLPLGSHDVTRAVQAISASRPDFILNTINGDTNVAFFRALRAAGITPQQVPTISFSVAEAELQTLDARLLAGDYAAWNYFQSIESGINADFVRRFRQRFGSARVTDDPIEASYFGVHLWANAVEIAGSARVSSIRRAVVDQSLRAPEGMVYVDAENRHTWKTVRIGRIRADGQFDIVWSSDKPIRPIPYPETRTHAQWESFLQNLFNGWGHRWQAPSPPAP